MKGGPVLELDGVRVAYRGRTVLGVANLAVDAGETLAVIGPNGSGKSTLLRVLALLERPVAGTVRVHGAPVARRADALLALRRRFATVFQAPLLFDATVFDNVALGLRFRRVPEDEARRRTDAWLARLGIAALARRAAQTLSGGEAQRTALARALVLEPEVLLLDEPFDGLDAPTREGLLLELQALLRESGVTTVLVTHDRDEALMLADRVAVLVEGRIAQVDRPAALFAAPATEAVARFVGAETIVPGVVSAGGPAGPAVRVGDREFIASGARRIGEAVLVCLRPEDVRLTRPVALRVPSGGQNTLNAVVRQVVPMGGQFRVHVDAGFDLLASIGKLDMDALQLAVGDPIVASFSPAAAHTIPAGADPSRIARRAQSG